MPFTVTLTGYTETAAMLAQVEAFIAGGQIGEAVRKAGEDAVRKRFDQLAKVQNKLGAPSTGFWKQAADSITSTINGGSVTLTISHRGVALHLYGGTVTPKGTSAITGKPITRLTIPKVAAAHGKTVATLRALGVQLYPGRGGLLHQTGAQRDPKNDEMWFVLARQAVIKPNPTVIPSEAALAAAAADGIDELLAILKL